MKSPLDELESRTIQYLPQSNNQVLDFNAHAQSTSPPVECSARLKVLSIEELLNQPARQYLVKGVLGAGEMSIWYGAPGCGKSFLLLDIARHVAAGENWFERRVRQGSALYVAAEGGGGLRNRVTAMLENKRDTSTLPLRFIQNTVDLLHPGRVISEIVDEAREMSAALIVIDTLSRALAGGNENSPDDMGAFILNVDRIREETGAHIAIVHHGPKSGSDSPRGHSSLLGAADTCVKIEKRGSCVTAKIEKNKDDAEGSIFDFMMKVREIEFDDDGDPVTSCILTKTHSAKTMSAAPSEHLTSREMRAFETLKRVIADDGYLAQPKPGMNKSRVVSVKAWGNALKDAGVTNPDNIDSARGAFAAIKKALDRKGKICISDCMVWLKRDAETERDDSVTVTPDDRDVT
jgi:hypothetical protein